MYGLYRKDLWGNDIPHMVTQDEPVATWLMKAGKDFITKVVEVPRNVNSLIKL